MLRLKPLGLAMPSHPVRAWHACTSFCPRQDTGSPTGFFCAACSRGTGTVSMPAGSFHSRNPKTRIRLAELAGPRELLNFLPVLACVPLTLPFRTLSVWLLTRTGAGTDLGRSFFRALAMAIFSGAPPVGMRLLISVRVPAALCSSRPSMCASFADCGRLVDRGGAVWDDV